MNLKYKYHNFIDWIKRHPVTILMITFEPTFDNKYHRYECSTDDIKLHDKKGLYRGVFTFTAKARMIG